MKKPNKTYYKGNLKVEEYFENGKLWMYRTTERTQEYKLMKDYFSEDIYDFKNKIHYNHKGIPFWEEKWVLKKDNYYDYFEYLIPVFEGYEDASIMTDEDKKNYSELLNNYIINNELISKYDSPW